MTESKVSNENYIVIQGWMVRNLGLKGNELMIYACIYGFSQADDQCFSGSLKYLSDWTNSTKRGVIKNLKSLVEKGLLIKTDRIINDVKFCEYRVAKMSGCGEQSSPWVVNKVHQGGEQSSPGVVNKVHQGGEQSSPNNIDNNIDIYTKDNIYSAVVLYLNEKAGTKYKATSRETKTCIHARIAEGYTEEDFKTVIDKKCDDWIGTDYEQYLRPKTLFGTKFESYLNARIVKKRPVNTGIPSGSSQNDLDDLF